MVDVEPIVDNSEICRSIASVDQSHIRAAAAIESGTIIGYYHNNQRLDMHTEEEEKHAINSRIWAREDHHQHSLQNNDLIEK